MVKNLFMSGNRIYVYLFFLLSLPVIAQTEISGKITAASGEALPGASILLKDKEQK